jgi:hypothetical protein
MNAACQVFDFPPRRNGDPAGEMSENKDASGDGSVDGGENDVSISLSDKAQSLSAEAMELVAAGLSMIFWYWAKNQITFHFALPDKFLDYRDKRPRRLAHVRAVFGRFRSIMTPAIFDEMTSHLASNTLDDRCAAFQPLCLKKVAKVEVLEQSGQIRVVFITEVSLGDLGLAASERISIVRQSRVNAAAFADCHYTFACN